MLEWNALPESGDVLTGHRHFRGSFQRSGRLTEAKPRYRNGEPENTTMGIAVNETPDALNIVRLLQPHAN